MIVDELKNSILQSATEGKLVNQKHEFNASKEFESILEDTKDNKKYSYNKLWRQTCPSCFQHNRQRV